MQSIQNIAPKTPERSSSPDYTQSPEPEHPRRITFATQPTTSFSSSLFPPNQDLPLPLEENNDPDHDLIAPPSSPLPSVPKALMLLKTPSSHLPRPGGTPLTTPIQRHYMKQKNGHWSAKDCFSPITKELISLFSKEHRFIVYSIKGESSDITFRYIGETESIAQRTRQHASSANTTRGSSGLTEMQRKLRALPDAKLSIGILAIGEKPGYVENLEDRTITKCKNIYSNVINQRKGGGGGHVMTVQPTLSDSAAKAAFKRLLQKPYHKAPLTKLKGRIVHTLSKEERTAEKVTYIFERTFSSRKKKRLIGMTSPRASKRLSSHFSYINNPEKSPRKNKEFYKDVHSFWKQFTISVIPVKTILDKGATLGQIETIAIKMFGGMKGYNQNKGGGGAASRK